MNTDLIQPEPMKEEQLEYLKKMINRTYLLNVKRNPSKIPASRIT